MSSKLISDKIPAVILGAGLLVFLLLFVGLKLSIENVNKNIIVKTDSLTVLSNKKLRLVAQTQSLSRAERIKSIAVEELGMIESSGSIGEIKIK